MIKIVASHYNKIMIMSINKVTGDTFTEVDLCNSKMAVLNISA